MTPITDTPGLPGYSADIVDTSSGGSLSADTGTAFVLGFTEKGPDAPTPVRSLAEFVTRFGGRTDGQLLYDTLDVAFREGLSQAVVVRVLGDAKAKATASIYDQSGSTSGDIALSATAKDYGAGGNKLNVEAVYTASPAGVVFKVSHDVDGLLETSPSFATRAEAVAWASDYVTLALGVSNELPRSQTVSLSGGADDHASADDDNWQASLDLLVKELGPGQVAMPGRTTDAAHLQLAAHAAAFYRNPVLDFDDTAVVADLVADAGAVSGADGDRYCGAFGPWLVVPGIAAGTTRTVPASAAMLGLIARVEQANGGNSNVAAAGERYPLRYVTALTQDAFSDAERATLNGAGFNVLREIDGEIVVYGYRSLADPINDPEWVQFSGSREMCALAAKLGAVLRMFVFEQIDGRGLKLAELGGLLAGVCLADYNLGALYGATPEEAFEVDTGAAVNTPSSLAAGQLKAAVRARTSPFAEQAEITVTHVNSAEAL